MMKYYSKNITNQFRRVFRLFPRTCETCKKKVLWEHVWFTYYMISAMGDCSVEYYCDDCFQKRAFKTWESVYPPDAKYIKNVNKRKKYVR